MASREPKSCARLATCPGLSAIGLPKSSYCKLSHEQRQQHGVRYFASDIHAGLSAFGSLPRRRMRAESCAKKVRLRAVRRSAAARRLRCASCRDLQCVKPSLCMQRAANSQPWTGPPTHHAQKISSLERPTLPEAKSAWRQRDLGLANAISRPKEKSRDALPPHARR
jgi:hypothetical protein